MKRGQNLKREFKEIVASHGLYPDRYLLVAEMEFYLKLKDKETGKIIFTDKFKRHTKNVTIIIKI